jgi:hypothetical protein
MKRREPKMDDMSPAMRLCAELGALTAALDAEFAAQTPLGSLF